MRAEIDRTMIGRRVKMILSTDSYTPTPSGMLGTVKFIDDTGTVFVDWDDGSRLGMIPGSDIWEVLP